MTRALPMPNKTFPCFSSSAIVIHSVSAVTEVLG